ncbi:MAG: hypothetical protein JXR60_11240 [Bacteroidales bacterium]|nr:hypothetical protein [Bacteroidales bacterium]
MTSQEQISAWSRLGSIFSLVSNRQKGFADNNKQLVESFDRAIDRAYYENRWFTKDEIYFALNNWSKLLNKQNLEQWVSEYSLTGKSMKIGVVQAGNIPLVWFHDFLSVLISGHSYIGKASNKDAVLPRFISDLLIQLDGRFGDKILWVERIKEVDAIIATGSNNSSRYFEYYFKNIPHIIRKNRGSWAIIDGTESAEELKLLGEDIFRYYGLGCRNISKIFVPDGYRFDPFFQAIEPYNYVYNNNKYANNYDYNQSIYLMNQESFLQNGFLMLKENIGHHSPLSVIFYEHYSRIETVLERINIESSNIQCVVSHFLPDIETVAFGNAQSPSLKEYADGIDILDWLINLSNSDV